MINFNNNIFLGNQIVFIKVPCGPTGKPIEMSFQKRKDPSLMDEVGMAISSIVKHVPDGVVVFFPSFSYMDAICI